MRYVELHARSAFSFLQGASAPEELAAQAAELDLPAIAVLDRDGVYGSPRAHMACRKAGLKAHVGAELTLADGSRLPVLVRTREGYQNLCRLVTRMKLRAPKGRGEVTEDEVAERAAGLVALTGDQHGPLAAALDAAGLEAAVARAERLKGIFGAENLYAELQRHCDRQEEARNHAVQAVARKLGLPLLATNGVSHARKEEREVLDVLTCVHHKVKLATAGRLLSRNAERHLKGARAMSRIFRDVPEAVANTVELSSRLEFTLTDLGYEFPRYPVPWGQTMDSFLRTLTLEGARGRFRPFHERARQQIERELALIGKLELAGYFLIVWDLVRFCREQGILVQGRGSAANSAVCYALGITAVDPVKMDLLFERFLSEERGEWPDIDLDLPSGDQRERVIQYVYERHGKRGAAMTANVITYRGRSAAREVGKVLGFDEATLGKLSSLVGRFEWRDPRDTPERSFKQAGLDLDSAQVRRFLQLYVSVQDLPRHLGQHSGGMVVCQGRLDSVVPLEPASMPGRVVVQWDKDDCADLGLIKVDLLGLGMMAVLEDCLKVIPEAYGEEVDLAHLPADDPQVYAALQKADTVGLFQIESRAQMSCLPRLKPKTFYDIVVQVAIIRPGPIVGNMVHPYLRRRQGREPVDSMHPALEPVLARTLGVPLFQEQLLRMAMIAAGFTGGEAEELRRAFGFKRAEKRMAEVEVKLRAGMERNGITGENQDRIVQAITSFALYGFPESHAASFALIAYASAWLKTHYLAAFTACLLNNQPMGFYHPATLIKDAQRHGLHVRPVDVTVSNWLCTVERATEQSPGGPGGDEETLWPSSPQSPLARSAAPDVGRRRPRVNKDGNGHSYEPCLRLGLRQVRGLRESAGRALVEERARGPFRSIDDLARRVKTLRRDELERLAEVGALNALPRAEAGRPAHRRSALWDVARAAQPAGPLLTGLEDADGSSPLAPMTDLERLSTDIRGTGVTLGRHLMGFRRADLDARGVCRAAELPHLPGGRRVAVAGCVIVRQRPGTAKGFLFLSIEDETGIANIIATPDTHDRFRPVWVGEPLILVEGTLQNLDGVVSVKATRVEGLPLHSAAQPSKDEGWNARGGPAIPPSHDFH